MATWISQATDHLWQSGLAAVPLVVLTAMATRFIPVRPATRHLMWLMVLLWPLVPPFLPRLENPWPQESAVASGTPQTAPSEVASDPKSEALRAVHPPVPATDRGAAAHSESTSGPGNRDSATTGRPPSRPGTPRGGVLAQDSAPLPDETVAPVGVTPTSPSPRSGARTASAKPELLAQRRGAVGLPPTVPAASSALRAVSRGPYCPLFSAIPPVCPADAVLAEFDLAIPRRIHPRTPAPTVAGGSLGSIASAPGDGRVARALGAEAAPASVLPADRSADEVRASAESDEPGFVQLAVAEAWSRTLLGIQQWSAVTLRVRDDIASLPALPLEIWLTGTLLLLLIAVCRIAGFRRLVRHADPAPADVVAFVSKEAERIGLRRAPQVWMVRRRMSPMVWCAVRPRLLLPVQLWADLDDVGRRAVVVHELAHLRRRDHWVLWADGLVGSLYWWHPVVWWVRRRMHLEAEYCCDAWVTALLPRTRRAYAEALLKTRQYLGEGSGWVPAMGMGISSGRAKRFARRLTMVMTTSAKPGASVWGVGLVLLIATFGWLAAPARSCPKEEKKPCDKAKAEKLEKVEADKARELEKTTFERHMAERALLGKSGQPTPPGLLPALLWSGEPGALQLVSDDEGEQERIRELQAQLKDLGRKLEELHREMENGRTPRARSRGDGRSGHGHWEAHGHPVPPAPPAPPIGARPPVAPAPTATPRPAMPPMPEMPPVPRIAEFPKPGQTWADVTEEKLEWRTYKLSDGKREDFTKFMSRSDVPVLVRPNPVGIDIQAGERAHRVFNAFFQLVDPSDERAEALFFPPVFAVGLGEGAAVAPGACGGCQGCAGCVGDRGCDGCKNCKCEKCDKVRKERAEAKKIREEARAMARDIRVQSQGQAAQIRAEARARAREIRDRLRQDARRIRTEAHNQEELIRSLEEQAETLREQSDRMRERAERARERAERIREREEREQEDGDNPTNGAFQEHLEMLERNAERLDENSEDVGAKIAELMAQVEMVRNGSSQLEQHADEVEHRAEAVEDLTDSIEGLEASPELAESIASLAAEIEQLAAPAAEAATAELFAAIERIDFPALLEGTGSVSAEALEAAIEAATEALEEAQEAAEDEDEAAADAEDEDGDEDEGEEEYEDDDSDDEDEGESDEDDNDDHGVR